MRGRSLARGAIAGACIAWGAPVLVASCGGSSSDAPPDAAPADARPADVTVNDGADTGTDDVAADVRHEAACSIPPGVRAACDGADPRVVFYPPVACDPKALDGGARDAATDGDAGDGGGDPCSAVSPTDVSFTPAACRAFVDLEMGGAISFDPGGRAPIITEPADGDALTADEWSIFTWTKGPLARRGVLASWIEPEAHALTPLGGDGYVIEFTQGCTEVLRAMVASTFWAPDPASWNLLAGTQGPVTVRVYWAKFDKDVVVVGPVASTPVTITMQK